MKTKIYSLQDENGNIRYIGKTMRALQCRLRAHLYEAKNGAMDHRCCWIRSVMSRGKWPSIFLVGEVEGNGSDAERAWIKYFRDEGVDLVNTTIGGEGVVGYKHGKDARRKMSLVRTGTHRSEETRRRMSEAQKGPKNHQWKKHPSGKTRGKMSESHEGRKLSEEHKRKLSGAKIGKPRSEETKRRISETLKGRTNYYWLGRHHSETTKQKISKLAKNRKIWYWSGKHLTQEHKRKISESGKRAKSLAVT